MKDHYFKATGLEEKLVKAAVNLSSHEEGTKSIKDMRMVIKWWDEQHEVDTEAVSRVAVLLQSIIEDEEPVIHAVNSMTGWFTWLLKSVCLASYAMGRMHQEIPEEFKKAFEGGDEV